MSTDFFNLLSLKDKVVCCVDCHDSEPEFIPTILQACLHKHKSIELQ